MRARGGRRSSAVVGLSAGVAGVEGVEDTGEVSPVGGVIGVATRSELFKMC